MVRRVDLLLDLRRNLIESLPVGTIPYSHKVAHVKLLIGARHLVTFANGQAFL